jgi:hypothetical protein
MEKRNIPFLHNHTDEMILHITALSKLSNLILCKVSSMVLPRKLRNTDTSKSNCYLKSFLY